MPFQPTSSLPPIQGVPAFHYSPPWGECSIIYRIDEVVVIGDPNNASYEWVIIVNNRVVAHSDAGYGQAGVAMRDGLVHLHPDEAKPIPSLGFLGDTLPAGLIGDPPDVDTMSADDISAELFRRGIDTEESFQKVHQMLDDVIKTPPDHLCKWPHNFPCLSHRLVLSGDLEACVICAPHLERVRGLMHPAEADANRLAQAIRDWKASQGMPHTGDLLDDALDAHDLRHNGGELCGMAPKGGETT